MEPFLGQVVMFGGNFAPRSWMYCNGQLLSISQWSALFSILGTTYGGDGRTTFALPDLRGRTPIGTGTGPGLSPHQLGQRAGSEYNYLNVAQLPAHNHTGSLHVSSADATQSAATNGSTIATPGTLSGRTCTATQGWNAGTPNVSMNPASVQTGLTGGNQAVNNMQPFLTLNYIMCVQGIFPSRN